MMNVSLDKRSPGISFSMVYGRITIFASTLNLLGMPEFFRFLFNPESGRFAIQACGMDAEGAKQRPILGSDESIEIRNIELVRLVYSALGWNNVFSYRAVGELFSKEQLVDFDLRKALEIHEGRVVRQGN